MTAVLESARGGQLAIRITGAASADAGGIGEIANPESANLLIREATLYVIANSTGAANLSCGVDVSGGTFTDIINALAMAAAAGKVYNGNTFQGTTKTEITAPVIWTAAKKLGFTGSASTVGLDAILFVRYLRLDVADEDA